MSFLCIKMAVLETERLAAQNTNEQSSVNTHLSSIQYKNVRIKCVKTIKRMFAKIDNIIDIP